jgi:anti-sigma regulatory factor (Ser/Thr protein kinase)
MHLVIPETSSAFSATLPGTPGSVAVARQLTRNALAGCPRTDDLLLAVSELASNAVIHSTSGQGGTFTVRVRKAPRWARAEIADQGPAATSQQAHNGWGLAIVAGVTDRTGADIQPNGHRIAWAEVSWPAGLSPAWELDIGERAF